MFRCLYLAGHVAHFLALLVVEIGALGTQLVVEHVKPAVRFVTDLRAPTRKKSRSGNKNENGANENASRPQRTEAFEISAVEYFLKTYIARQRVSQFDIFQRRRASAILRRRRGRR